jgi:hypothetical protein
VVEQKRFELVLTDWKCGPWEAKLLSKALRQPATKRIWLGRMIRNASIQRDVGGGQGINIAALVSIAAMREAAPRGHGRFAA